MATLFWLPTLFISLVTPQPASLASYQAAEENRIVVSSPWWRSGLDFDSVWPVPTDLSLSLPADAFSHAYSWGDYSVQEVDVLVQFGIISGMFK